MSDVTAQEMRVQAAQDQVWAVLRSKTDQIARIAVDGPEDDDDQRVIELVFTGLAGHLLFLRHQDSEDTNA